MAPFAHMSPRRAGIELINQGGELYDTGHGERGHHGCAFRHRLAGFTDPHCGKKASLLTPNHIADVVVAHHDGLIGGAARQLAGSVVLG